MLRLRWGAFAALLTLAGCGDDMRGDPDSGPDDDAGGDPCEGVLSCTTPGSSCDGDTLTQCAPDARGCLVETSTDCTTAGRVCDDTALPASCVRLPDECAGTPNLCDTAGTSCSGDTLVICAENADGCLVETRTDCSERADGTCETSAVGTRCEFTGDPCEGLDVCFFEGVSCAGPILVECVEDSFGCLVETRTDCSDVEFGFCDAESDPPACDASPTDPCEDVTECPILGSTCIGNTLHVCAPDEFGCQVDETTDCADDGNTCGVIDEEAVCIPPDPTCDIRRPGRTMGSACTRDSTCLDGLECFAEVPAPTIMVDAVNPDGTAAPDLTGGAWPDDGECSELCNLDDPGTVCGECSSCAGIAIGSIGFIVDVGPGGEPLGLCRSNCVPTPTDNSICRDGYQCSLSSSTCEEACTSDAQCKYTVGDVDGDGAGEIVYLGASYPGVCRLATGRCGTEGTAGAGAGDPCTDETDCEDDGLCLQFTALEDGYCTRLGCDHAGFECGVGETCDFRNIGAPACLIGCTVGAEAVADRLGADGHGSGCADGMACLWNGAGEPEDTDNGSCLPGSYNAVTTPNVGGACQTSADCYSPYGYGRCLWGTDDGTLATTGDEVGSGICVVSNCATFVNDDGDTVEGILPGIESSTQVCAGEALGEICANFGAPDEAPVTMCIQTCDAAADCAPGYACIAVLTGADNICWPNCEASTDCRAGATCEDAAGGACTPLTEACFCSDRVSRP